MKIGDILEDKFRVEKILEGGTASIFVCQVLGADGKVVLKSLKPSLYQQRERFYQEAVHWLEIGYHTNIVKCIYIEYINNTIFIVMEYVDGEPIYGNQLQSYLDEKYPFTTNDFMDFCIQFCNGMIYCEERYASSNKNFVYRDIKPENIMITKNHVVKIADFGLSGGTRGYMSPEQERCEELDQRSDIYSFGIVMRELLAHCNTEKTKEIRSIIEKCVQEERELRYHNFNELKKSIYTLDENFKENESILEEFNQPPYIYEQNIAISQANLFGADVGVKLFDSLSHPKLVNNRIKPGDWANPSTYYNKGVALENLGQLEEAEKYYRIAIKMDDKKVRFYGKLAECLMKEAKYHEVLENLEKALQLEPRNILLNYQLGDYYEEQMQYQKALDVFRNILNIDPANMHARRKMLGISCLFEEKDDKKKILNEIIAMEAHTGEEYFDKALACQYNKQYEDAIFYYECVIKLQPEKYAAYRNEAYCRYELRELFYVRKLMKKAIELIIQDIDTENDITLMKELIHCFIYLGNYGLASKYSQYYLEYIEDEEVAEQLKKIENNNYVIDCLELNETEIRELFLSEKYNECIENIEEEKEYLSTCISSIQIDYSWLKCYSFEVNILIRQERYEEAQEKVNAMLSIDHTNSDAYFHQAKLCQKKLEYKKAIQYYKKCLSYTTESDYITAILQAVSEIDQEYFSKEDMDYFYKRNHK